MNFIQRFFTKGVVEKRIVYCVDCKHSFIKNTGTRFARCSHPDAIKGDDYDHLVDKRLDHAQYCSLMRRWSCGIEGKYYEQKNTENNND